MKVVYVDWADSRDPEFEERDWNDLDLDMEQMRHESSMDLPEEQEEEKVDYELTKAERREAARVKSKKMGVTGRSVKLLNEINITRAEEIAKRRRVDNGKDQLFGS